MLSFASVALSLWLGLVAAACLRLVWRAAMNHSRGFSDHDFSRSIRGETCRDHNQRGPVSLGLIPTACRSVAHALRALTNAVLATLKRTTETILKALHPRGKIDPSLKQSLPGPFAETQTADLQIPVETPVAEILDSPKGTAKGKRVARISRQNSPNRRETPQSKQIRINKRTIEADTVVCELPKRHSGKNTEKANPSRARKANGTARIKRAKKPGHNVPLTARISA